jgi:hypothetical protein
MLLTIRHEPRIAQDLCENHPHIYQARQAWVQDAEEVNLVVILHSMKLYMSSLRFLGLRRTLSMFDDDYDHNRFVTVEQAREDLFAMGDFLEWYDITIGYQDDDLKEFAEHEYNAVKQFFDAFVILNNIMYNNSYTDEEFDFYVRQYIQESREHLINPSPPESTDASYLSGEHISNHAILSTISNADAGVTSALVDTV